MRKLKENIKAYSNLVPMVLAITIAFAMLFIGAFVNGEISDQLTSTIGSYNAAGGDNIVDDIHNTTNNISANWDSGIDIVQIVIIITLLAGAIGAIFLFTKFR